MSQADGQSVRTSGRPRAQLRVGLGHVGNPAAWRVKALSDDVEDEGQTAVFLSAVQRQALIAAASPPCSAFMRGLGTHWRAP